MVKKEYLIKYDVRIELDLYANGEEDARNIIRDIRKACFKFKGVDGASTWIHNPTFEEVI